jgi:hypothetical protein
MIRTSMPINAPCHGQTEESVKDWLRSNVHIGCAVAIRNTPAGFLQYVPATVVRMGRGRFEVAPLNSFTLSSAGNTFYYSGKNCWHPKGQTRLVIPTPEVIAAYGNPGDLGLR